MVWSKSALRYSGRYFYSIRMAGLMEISADGISWVSFITFIFFIFLQTRPFDEEGRAEQSRAFIVFMIRRRRSLAFRVSSG